MAKSLSFLGPQSELAGNQPEMSALVQMLMQANGMMPNASYNTFQKPIGNRQGGQMPGGQIPMGRPPVNKPPGSSLPPQVPPTTPPVTPPVTPPGTPPGGGAAPSSFSWEAWNKLPGVQDQNLSSVMQYLTSQYGGPQANPYAGLDWKKML